MFARTLAALAGVTLLAATPAVAQDTMSLSVSYADLDLSNAKDRAQFDRRVRAAARNICDDGMKGVASDMSFQACRAGIVSSVSDQLASRNTDGRVQLARAR
jgi:UrcA family protein